MADGEPVTSDALWTALATLITGVVGGAFGREVVITVRTLFGKKQEQDGEALARQTDELALVREETRRDYRELRAEFGVLQQAYLALSVERGVANEKITVLEGKVSKLEDENLYLKRELEECLHRHGGASWT